MTNTNLIKKKMRREFRTVKEKKYLRIIGHKSNFEFLTNPWVFETLIVTEKSSLVRFLLSTQENINMNHRIY